MTRLLLNLRQKLRLAWVVLLFAFALCSLPAAGQSPGLGLDAENTDRRYLVLDKPGLNKRIRFYPGQRIRFKLKGENYRYNAVLQAVGEKSIMVMDTPIFLDEIRKVYYTKPGTFLPLSAGSLTGGGILFVLMGVYNGLAHNNPDLIVPGAAAFVTGMALRPFYQRSFRIGGNRRLRTL
jgi:hypothetical protein